jgi:hypothetical protein
MLEASKLRGTFKSLTAPLAGSIYDYRPIYNLFYSDLIKIRPKEMIISLITLYNSLEMVEVPMTFTLHNALKRCQQLSKESVLNHKHGLELQLPFIIDSMSNLAVESIAMSPKSHSSPYRLLDWIFQLKHTESPILPYYFDQIGVTIFNPYLTYLSESKVYDEPLFHLLHIFPYTVAHCSFRNHGYEDWKNAVNYLEEIANTIVTENKAWRKNRGIDFIIPLSHPKLNPMMIRDSNPKIKEFIHQAYLKVDFDYVGHAPKDVIVPYFVSLSSTSKMQQQQKQQQQSLKREEQLFLFFSGRDNPIGGLRRQLLVAIRSLSLKSNEILANQSPEGYDRNNFDDKNESLFLVLDKEVKFDLYGLSHPSKHSTVESQHRFYNDYVSDLRRSRYCLVLSGDTSSTARFYEILLLTNGSCIPVILSDWFELPFSSIIDYTKAVIRYPESVMQTNVEGMIRDLRNKTGAELAEYRANLAQLKLLLQYPTPTSPHQDTLSLSILNPFSLTLLELLHSRQALCMNELSLHQVGMSSDFCDRLKQRRLLAEQVYAMMQRDKIARPLI